MQLSDIQLGVLVKTLPNKGNMVYEYNPFHNYRLTEDKFLYKDDYYTLAQLKTEFSITYSNNAWDNVPSNETVPTLCLKGTLVDFITDELSFDLEHPVDILPLYSYDGSVNLILNDGISVPKLINSRFSTTGKNTYEIIDRKGNNDTNIYDAGELFDIDTSLYKRVNSIPKITYKGASVGGNLKVGNYHFYFKLSDADGNETDFIGESSLVSIFIGFCGNKSLHTGTKNENSFKSVNFQISNIDTAYDYLYVYYTRSTAELNENYNTEYIKIEKKFIVNNLGICNINITGNENIINVTALDINFSYEIVDAVKAQTVCQNMLFVGNVHKPSIPYDELADLSLRFLPKLNDIKYDLLETHEYTILSTSNGYLDDKFIYNYVGYWDKEIYRLGVVYILKNNELSPVFNIRGGNIENTSYTEFNIYENDNKTRKYVDYNSINSLVVGSSMPLENVKGVVRFTSNKDTDIIHGIKIEASKGLINELLKYVKGFFFVRLPRIPTILALGLAIGIDKIARTPCIPTKGGILSSVANLQNTFIETNDINDVNYISEGFLNRYLFKLSGVTAFLSSKLQTISYKLINSGISINYAESNTNKLTNLKNLVKSVTSETTNTPENTTKKFVGRNNGLSKKTISKETDESRKLDGDFIDRIIIKDATKSSNLCVICPDYEVNLPYYNTIFTGNTHTIRYTKLQSIEDGYLTNDNRHFYFLGYKDIEQIDSTAIDIISVPDNTKVVGLHNNKFRSRAGEAEEAWRYEEVGTEYTDDEEKKQNTDIVRGAFGAYLATNSTNLKTASLFDILIPNYQENSLLEYFNIRMNDNSAYMAITDRYDINNLSDFKETNNADSDYLFNAFRGDCYICQFTHRINRNFNSPSAPYNDKIVDASTWRDHFKPNKLEEYDNINLGDVNAVLLGMWVTFKLRSSYNLNIRTLDSSNVDEVQMTGHPRGYYPYYSMSTEGTYKTPESLIYNKGFSKSLSERYNSELPDVPYIKNWFGTRIMYSDIHINDAYKNGFRVFRKTNEVDYTREYGEITKLISLNSNLLIVFEHGIAIAPVNLQAILNNIGLLVTTQQVLPEAPTVISDMFGSLWSDSIIKTSKGVYGVDTIAKKIWVTDGQSIECISDFKVQEFLNNNITLSEKELTPKLGIRNVKTFYNAYKHDVMFTFYDNTYGFLEKVWNLCYNELLNKFITFYSWVPSFMENIDNIPFSFNRDTSKWIAKLGSSHSENSFANGITLSNNVFDKNDTEIGTLSLSNVAIPDNMTTQIVYTLEPDSYGNYKHFNITGTTLNKNLSTTYNSLLSELYYRNKEGHCYSDDESNKVKSDIVTSREQNLPIFKNKEGKRLMLPEKEQINADKVVILLNIKATINVIINDAELKPSDSFYNKAATYECGTYESTVAIIPKWNMLFLTTDFWKHGQAGSFDIADDIYPCYWYGKQHPFEFECIVVNDPSVHKIFTNLEIVANKAKPESFHYEVVGESYDFAKDKPNMYFRQEAMKALWQYNGFDIEYNNDFLKVQTRQLPKSADLVRTYYARRNGINEIEDYYVSATSKSKDYQHLSGGEIVYYPNRLEFRVCNHVLAVDVDDLKDTSATSFGGRGLMSSNMRYLEDRWKVLINPLLIVYKNEYERSSSSTALCVPENSTWKLSYDGTYKLPPLPLYNSPIPDTIMNQGYIAIPGYPNESYGKDNALYKLYTVDTKGNDPFDESNWLDDVGIYKYDFGSALNRKETDMRDKFMKVKIRYTGDKLVVIDFLNTLYLVSYA